MLDAALDEVLDEGLGGAGGVGVGGVDERAAVDGAGEVAGLNTNFFTGAFIRGSADAAAGGLVEGGDGAFGSADEEGRAGREGTESEGLRAGFPSSPVSSSADSDRAATPGGVVVGSSFSDEPVKSLEKIPTEFVDSQSYHRPQRDRADRSALKNFLPTCTAAADSIRDVGETDSVSPNRRGCVRGRTTGPRARSTPWPAGRTTDTAGRRPPGRRYRRSRGPCLRVRS